MSIKTGFNLAVPGQRRVDVQEVETKDSTGQNTGANPKGVLVVEGGGYGRGSQVVWFRDVGVVSVLTVRTPVEESERPLDRDL